MTAISEDWVIVLVSNHLLLSPKFISIRKSKSTGLTMAGKRVSAPTLPPELWIYIHHLALADISPLNVQGEVIKYSGTPDHPLNGRELQRFLKAARSLQRVSLLWSELAKELLYKNIWVNDTKRWPSLSSALLKPDTASLVRGVRLSPTRFDHNAFVLQHCGPHIQVLVQPEFPRSERLYAADLGAPLPPMVSLKRVYWIESTWSAPLLLAVLAAAPNLKHLTLSSSSSIGSGLYKTDPPAPVFPPLSHLQSLVLLPLTSFCIRALLRDAAPLSCLTRLTIAPVHLEWDAFPVLPQLRTLILVDQPPSTRSRVPFPALLTRFPGLEELRYSAHIPAELPGEKEVQRAGALTCVRLFMDAGPFMYSEVRQHAMVLTGSTFGALERVVLDGPGWALYGRSEWEEWTQLRARGCVVAVG